MNTKSWLDELLQTLPQDLDESLQIKVNGLNRKRDVWKIIACLEESKVYYFFREMFAVLLMTIGG